MLTSWTASRSHFHLLSTAAGTVGAAGVSAGLPVGGGDWFVIVMDWTWFVLGNVAVWGLLVADGSGDLRARHSWYVLSTLNRESWPHSSCSIVSIGTQVSILLRLLQSMLQRSMGTSTVQRTEYKYKYSITTPTRIFLPANPSVRIPSYMYTQTLAPRLHPPRSRIYFPKTSRAMRILHEKPVFLLDESTFLLRAVAFPD